VPNLRLPARNLWVPGKLKPGLQPASPVHRRPKPRAALSTALTLGLTASFAAALAPAQQEAPPTQQSPAPIVRPRPRPATPTSQNAPADAAPLVPHPPRPHPVNPQTLSGVPAPTVQPTTTIRPRPAQTTPATAGTAPTATPKVPVATPNPATITATTSSAPAQPAEHTATAPKLSPVLNRNIIVLDPAHGGTDSGSRIGDNLLEKDVTLSLAFRLRSLLTARGFTVVLTRDSDAATYQATPSSAPAPLTLDDRAGIANRNRPAACLLLHATGRGSGLHLYTSELEPAPGEAATLPWLTAQAAWVPASQQLERSVASALGRSHVSLVSSTASIRPVDSLTCSALVLELAPQNNDPRSVNDAAYQESIAQAIAGALVFWQNQVQPPPRLSAVTPGTHTAHHHGIPGATPKEPQP
jgi:N-acetylmuramoyl-L-alanine amidase